MASTRSGAPTKAYPGNLWGPVGVYELSQCFSGVCVKLVVFANGFACEGVVWLLAKCVLRAVLDQP